MIQGLNWFTFSHWQVLKVCSVGHSLTKGDCSTFTERTICPNAVFLQEMSVASTGNSGLQATENSFLKEIRHWRQTSPCNYTIYNKT